jgi:hypothetical protein
VDKLTISEEKLDGWDEDEEMSDNSSSDEE